MTARLGPLQNVVQMHFRPRGFEFRNAGRRAFYAPDPPSPHTSGWFGRDFTHDSAVRSYNDWQGPSGISRWGKPILSWPGSVTRYWFQDLSGGDRERGGYNVYRWGRFYAQVPGSHELLGAALRQDSPSAVTLEAHTSVHRYDSVILDQMFDAAEEITVFDADGSAEYLEVRDWQRAIGGLYIPPQSLIPAGATIKVTYTAKPTWLQVIVYDSGTPAERCYRRRLNGEEDPAGDWTEIGSRTLLSGEIAPNPYLWNESGTTARSVRQGASSSADRYIGVQCAVSDASAIFSTLFDTLVSAAYVEHYSYTDDGGGAWHGSADISWSLSTSVDACYDYVGDTLVTGTISYALSRTYSWSRTSAPPGPGYGEHSSSESATVTFTAPDLTVTLVALAHTVTYSDDGGAAHFDLDYDHTETRRAILALDIRHSHSWVLEMEYSKVMDAVEATAYLSYGIATGDIDTGTEDGRWRWRKVLGGSWSTVDTKDPAAVTLDGENIDIYFYRAIDYLHADVSASVAPVVIQPLRAIHEGASVPFTDYTTTIDPAHDYTGEIVVVDGDYALRLGGNLSSGVTDATFVDYTSSLDLATVAGTATPGGIAYL
jgi:hypothetical protein